MASSVLPPLPADEMPSKVRKRRVLALPQVADPFQIHSSLAAAHAHAVDWARTPQETLTAFAASELSEAATTPSTQVLRVVHPRFPQPLYIHRPPSRPFVTVLDVLAGIHSHLWSDLPSTLLDALDAYHRREVIRAAEDRCRTAGLASDSVRFIDLLGSQTAFAGLIQDVPRAHWMVAPGTSGIDEYQSLTWILQTDEPSLQMPMGLGCYPRHV